MAIGQVTELLAYRTVSMRDNIDTLTRGFNVEGLGPDLARFVPFIPRYGDSHPDNPGMIVRSVSAGPRGTGSLVQATYAPREFVGGGQPPVNDSAEDFWGIDVSFDYEDIDIPLFQRSSLTTTDPQGLPLTKLVYADYRAGIPYRKRVPYYRVTTGVTFAEPASLGDIFALSELIVDQTDKIHRLFGRDVVFSCEGLQYVSRTEYKVTYRWSQDLGIPNEWEADTAFGETLDANLGRRGSILYPFADEDFVIPPFKGMRIDGNTDPAQPPIVTFFDKYKRDDNGWQNLPGLV
jgi:hypothetical protein